ncbi:MAG: transglycosylase domain-containing protein [Candidatus Babeliales bacterium]
MGGLFFVSHYHIVDLSVLEHYEPGTPSVLLDCHGVEWARFARDKRKPISLNEMPQHLIQAFIAAEDHDFFHHPGISIKGIVRSTLVNIYHGRKKQGASTITQQLIKLLYVGASKTFTRKFKEQLMALLIERQFSKEQILQTYLNHVYFGCGIYGVEAASQRFWGISAQQLSIEQAATLAAVVKSPGLYSPLLCPLSSEQRRNVVLRSMRELNFIDKKVCATCQQQPLGIVEHQQEFLAPHLQEAIRQEVEALVGKSALYSEGYRIQTTLDINIQRCASRAFAEHMRLMHKEICSDIDGALVTLDVASGAVRALVGGFDFTKSKFNRAMQAQRQMGSILKPLIYAAAIEGGLRFDDTFIDEPLSLTSGGTVWQPRNNTLTFDGQMTLAHALSRSNNIVSIKALLTVGPEKAAEIIEKGQLGLVPAYPSLALGCIDRTLIDVACTFNIFANHGVYTKPHYIVWIKDALGKKIYKSLPEQKMVVKPHVADQVNSVLQASMERGKKRRKEWIDSEAIGKTGTTNDWRTTWFAGATPELTTAIYIGCDDNRPMGVNCYASRMAFPIWFGLHKDVPCNSKRFTFDHSLKAMTVDAKTGMEVAQNAPGAMTILVPKNGFAQSTNGIVS